MTTTFDIAEVGRERALFARVGLTLYGAQWQERMARELGVSGRSVRYWLSGRHAIPVGIWGELRSLAILRRREIGAVIVELDSEW